MSTPSVRTTAPHDPGRLWDALLEAAGRSGSRVLHRGRTVGSVAPGALSPTLADPIALAVVEVAVDQPGTRLEIDLRGQRVEVQVVALPVYRRRAATDHSDRRHRPIERTTS